MFSTFISKYSTKISCNPVYVIQQNQFDLYWGYEIKQIFSIIACKQTNTKKLQMKCAGAIKSYRMEVYRVDWEYMIVMSVTFECVVFILLWIIHVMYGNPSFYWANLGTKG